MDENRMKFPSNLFYDWKERALAHYLQTITAGDEINLPRDLFWNLIGPILPEYIIINQAMIRP